MRDQKIPYMSVESARDRNRGGLFLDDDLAYIDDVQMLTIPGETRRSRCLILGICLEGSASYNLNTLEHTIGPGDIIIINPGQVIDGYTQQPGSKGIGLMVSNRFVYEVMSGVSRLSSLFTFTRLHPVFHLTEEEQSNLLLYVNLLKQKIGATNHHFRHDIVRSLLQALIYDMGETIARIENNTENKKSRAESIYIEFMTLVERDCRTERRVSQYAQALHITPKYLAEIVKAVSQRTPNDWIDDYVVLELRTLLKNTNLSIKEIAEKMNFPNQSFLGKYFKEHVGMSPSEYRRMNE